jgi:outer membrane protein TolC
VLCFLAGIQDQAVKAATRPVVVATNQFKAGTASSLAVIVVQAIALNDDVTAVNILGRRTTAAVLLIKDLGGGWESSDLPEVE